MTKEVASIRSTQTNTTFKAELREQSQLLLNDCLQAGKRTVGSLAQTAVETLWDKLIDYINRKLFA